MKILKKIAKETIWESNKQKKLFMQKDSIIDFDEYAFLVSEIWQKP